MTNTLHTIIIAAGDEVAGIDALGLSPITILIQGLVFVILFFVVRKFALSAIMQNLNDRHDRIEDGLKFADQAEKRTKEVNAETEKLMKDARKQSAGMINEAKTEATALAAEIDEKARAKADKTMANADESIKDQIAKAEGQLKEDIVSYVRQATEKVLSEKLDSTGDEALIKRAVKEVQSA